MIFFTDPVTGCRLRLGYGDGVRPNHPLAVAVLSLGGVGSCPTYVVPIRPSRDGVFRGFSEGYPRMVVYRRFIAASVPFYGCPIRPIYVQFTSNFAPDFREFVGSSRHGWGRV